MKSIKLLGIFLIIVVCVFIAINWDSIFPPKTNVEFPPENLINISEQCESIRNKWDSVASWDRNLYDECRKDIDQSKGMGLYSQEGYNTVNNTLRETAANKACEAYKSGLKSKDFSHSKLEVHYNGVKEVSKLEKMDEDLRIKEIVNIHDLYKKIKKFVESGRKIYPTFDTDNASWTSFNDRKKGILATAKKYRENSMYSYVEGIPGFASALQEINIINLIDSQRNSFYKTLSDKIVEYYSKKEATQALYDELDTVFTKFSKEDNNNSEAIANVLIEMGEKLKTAE